MPLTFISSYYLNSAIGAGKIVPNLAQNTLIYSGLLSLALMWSCFLMETRLGKIPFAQKILYTALITALAAALVGLFLRFGLGTLKGPYRFIDHTFTPFLAAAVGAGLMCLFLCRISRPFWGFVVGYAALRLGNLLVFVLLGLASNINWGKTLQSLIPSAFLFAGMAYGLLALFSKRSLVQQPGG
jgi:hypothetical protein